MTSTATWLVCVFASSTLAYGQDATFKENVRLVEVYATVFDHGGHAVHGLTKDQFEIRDEGKPQPIRVFEPTSGPLACALLLDTTGSMRNTIPTLRNAARNLMDALRPGDSAAMYSFAEHITELQEMTTDKAAARRALARMRAGGRTALFDSVTQLALQLEKRPGKKVIIVLTDGGDNASVLNREFAAARARKAGVPVFAVAEGDALENEDAAKLLHDLAEGTGGHMYKAPHAKDLEGIFRDISLNLQSAYLLAFQAPAEDKTASWHQLQVVVKDAQKPVRVRARTGYSPE